MTENNHSGSFGSLFEDTLIRTRQGYKYQGLHTKLLKFLESIYQESPKKVKEYGDELPLWCLFEIFEKNAGRPFTEFTFQCTGYTHEPELLRKMLALSFYCLGVDIKCPGDILELLKKLAKEKDFNLEHARLCFQEGNTEDVIIPVLSEQKVLIRKKVFEKIKEKVVKKEPVSSKTDSINILSQVPLAIVQLMKKYARQFKRLQTYQQGDLVYTKIGTVSDIRSYVNQHIQARIGRLLQKDEQVDELVYQLKTNILQVKDFKLPDTGHEWWVNIDMEFQLGETSQVPKQKIITLPAEIKEEKPPPVVEVEEITAEPVEEESDELTVEVLDLEEVPAEIAKELLNDQKDEEIINETNNSFTKEEESGHNNQVIGGIMDKERKTSVVGVIVCQLIVDFALTKEDLPEIERKNLTYRQVFINEAREYARVNAKKKYGYALAEKGDPMPDDVLDKKRTMSQFDQILYQTAPNVKDFILKDEESSTGSRWICIDLIFVARTGEKLELVSTKEEETKPEDTHEEHKPEVLDTKIKPEKADEETAIAVQPKNLPEMISQIANSDEMKFITTSAQVLNAISAGCLQVDSDPGAAKKARGLALKCNEIFPDFVELIGDLKKQPTQPEV